MVSEKDVLLYTTRDYDLSYIIVSVHYQKSIIKG